jgi:hypothetical protein
MTEQEPDFLQTLQQTVAERPTFAAMALTAIHERDAIIARQRTQLAVMTIWLRVWDAYRKLPTPRPALTTEQIDQITADVIAGLKEQG